MGLFDDVKARAKWEDLLELKETGENFTTEDDVCPLCGHNKDFVIYGESKRFKCFGGTGGEQGDIIEFYRITHELKDSITAALELARKYGIATKTSGEKASTAFDVIAEHLHEQLNADGACPDTNGLTPLEYQLQRRGHTKEGLTHFQVGWTGEHDILPFLEKAGINAVENGFVKNRKPHNIWPKNCFIYPHIHMGHVVYFTVKDPKKESEYNMLKSFHKNPQVLFYNQRSRTPNTVYVVEGENDVITLWEHGLRDVEIWATNGQLSSMQKKALARVPDVRTIFDNDAAGANYRALVKGRHFLFPDGFAKKDIDDFLRDGGALNQLIEMKKEMSVHIPIKEEDGGYIRLVATKDDVIPKKLTNFTIGLSKVYTYLEDFSRNREVIITREDGFQSFPFELTSEQKTSTSSFKRIMAQYADGSFYGNDEDLIAIWDHVYAKQDVREVHIPTSVGYQPEEDQWLFANAMVGKQNCTLADGDGIIWLPDQDHGLRIKTLAEDSAKAVGMPYISLPDDWGDPVVEFEHEFLRQLALNRGSPGDALIMLAWIRANVYTPYLFLSKSMESFPFLYLYGDHGSGKSHLAKILSAFFGDPEPRFVAMSNYGSGAGVMRKLGYYSSMPFVFDDLRENMLADQGTMRGFYNRVGRSLASMSSSGANRVKEQPVLSNFILTGETYFKDKALKSRCVSLFITKTEEDNPSFSWLKGQEPFLSEITAYHLYNARPWEEIKADLPKWREHAINLGCIKRAADNWRLLLPEVYDLRDAVFPDFDFDSYIRPLFQEESNELGSQSLVNEFVDRLSYLKITSGRWNPNTPVYRLEDDILYLPVSGLVKLINQEYKIGYAQALDVDTLRNQFREQSYFLKASVKTRIKGNSMNAMTLNWPEVPDIIRELIQNMKEVSTDAQDSTNSSG
jgi:hypothetical protein